MKSNSESPEKYDLAAAYRIYPKVSKVPPVFSDDKYKLSELCFKSFAKSLGDLKVKLWVILDGCPHEYKDIFTRHFDEKEIIFIETDAIGNYGTYRKQIEILTSQDFSELVYFAEDDYFYLSGQFHHLTDFMKSNDEAEFVTAYDHLDYYNSIIHDYKSKIIVKGERHWRTVSATCITFLAKKKSLLELKDVFLTYSDKKNYDASYWTAITKIQAFNFPLFIRILNQPAFIKVYIKAWLFCWKQILFGKKRKLYAPMPSIATHMNVDFLAPTIDWYKYFEEY
ncbi:MAG: hypothetical protein QG635_998 [Bacteroidota bacterium]|nr:hypothetical protein [Bacteroidota bacterium]